ncbi:MAG: four helix bundle protein [Fidelibacterota bacterium]
MGSFKDLEVFHLSVQYMKSIYQTTKTFPKEELYGLTNQLRRAAVSIPSSIAEGSARRTASDQRRFVDIAIGSLYESHAQLIVAGEIGYITDGKLSKAEDFVEKLKAKLLAYRKSLTTRPPASDVER